MANPFEIEAAYYYACIIIHDILSINLFKNEVYESISEGKIQIEKHI